MLATVVSAALIQEEGRTQLLVYYVSQAFQGAEANYPRIKKIAFALVVASRKLHPYFQEPYFGDDGPTHKKVYEQARDCRKDDLVGNRA